MSVAELQTQIQVLQIAGVLWGAIFIIWAISAIGSKRTVRDQGDWRSRLSLWVVAAAWWLLFSQGVIRGPLAKHLISPSEGSDYAGLGLTILGLGFALWARIYIGRDWSGGVTLQEGHKVKRGGPYAIVRHPIYTGFMLATLGTAIIYGTAGGLLSALMVMGAWGYKSHLEESLLIAQFGAEYEQYRREVKGLIPFVW